MSDDYEHFEMVMPFIACESEGGPYRDADWVAGYECGTIATAMACDRLDGEDYPVRVANLPQLDLIAMYYGYTMHREPLDEHWVRVTFERTSEKVS